MSRALLFLFWAVAAGAVPLAAQSPADRSGIEALRDSLGAVTDSTALRQIEARAIAIATQQRDDPLLHLRLGFIAYRLGEVTTGKSHYDNAASEFEWAAELRPDWPYAWYGLGLAELALGEHSVIAIENLRQMLGRDYLSKAARAFARATLADPSFAAAVVDLANTALTQRIKPRLDVALTAVRLSAASPAGRHPEVQLVRGRVEREAGEADSALAGFRAYLAVGGDSGVGLLELARTYYFARRAPDAWRAYFAGGRAATAAGLTLYRTDLSWIADSVELAAFDALEGAATRARWLEEFWTRRDVADARQAGERLAEHYRRWFYARHSFRLVSRHRHYDITEVYRAKQLEFDDRGVIYLRHGEPDRRAHFICREAEQPNGEGCATNESWLYRREDGDLIFHFAARGDVQDYKLIESLVDALGFRRGVQAGSFSDPQVSELYASRERFGPLYSRAGHSLNAQGSAIAQDRAQGRRSIALGTSSDSYAQRFEQPLDVVSNEFVVGGDSGGQMLQVVFAVPGDRLTGEPGGGGLLYPLHFRVIVSDSADRVVARLDTVRVFSARQALRQPAYLTGRLALPVPAGRYRYRLLVMTPDGVAGDLVRQDSLEVSALRSDGVGGLAVSDVVLGREGSGLVWVQAERGEGGGGGDTVRLNPLSRFPEGSAAELYYEIYGLTRGATYHTVVRLEREGRRSLFGAIRGLFGGGRAPVLLEFDAAAEGPVTRVHRGVALRDVAKGSYRLTVVISDPASGASATRTRRFQVVAR